jgi:hypothetical protein
MPNGAITFTADSPGTGSSAAGTHPTDVRVPVEEAPQTAPYAHAHGEFSAFFFTLIKIQTPM